MDSATSAALPMGSSANEFALPEGHVSRTRRQRERDDKLKLMYSALVRAANNGVACPSNEDLSRSLGYASPTKASDLIALLEAMGFITVERGHMMRVVTIVKTGKRTAGKLGKLRPKNGWTEDQDAILMDGIAEGLTFAAVGRILRKTKNTCISRFHRLAASLGHQAA